MILALESSCDETAVAVFDPAHGLAGEWLHSQIALHESYGGVVPDLASREHLAHFGPLLRRALEAVPAEKITQIAVTNGPGLAACLAMGVAAAKSLALSWRVPVTGINHLRAHAFSPFIATHAEDPSSFDRRLAEFLPHLGLLVSGGNTALFCIDEARRIRLLASTLDDAAGEALDKGAKLLGFGYPGGPQIEKLAQGGDPRAFDFPKAIARRTSLDFSFSGLKTSLRYQLEKMLPEEIERAKADLASSYQTAVIDALVRKTDRALELAPDAFADSAPVASGGGKPWRSLGLSGGVANNRLLQARLKDVAAKFGVPFLRAEAAHSGDNAGMIAFAAWVEREAHAVDARGLELEIAPSLPLAAE